METRDAMRRRARFALEVLEKREAPASFYFAHAIGNVSATTTTPPWGYNPSGTSAQASATGISVSAPAAAFSGAGAISS